MTILHALTARALVRVLLIAGLTAAPWEPDPPAEPSQSGTVHTVDLIPSHSFHPQVVQIRPGDSVVWRNRDQTAHTVVGDPLRALHRIDIEPPSPPKPFHSDEIEPGGTYQNTFTLEGVYRYVCIHHEDEGMNGTVIVERDPQ
ncbi:MAG TPA: plastocyanin/azurin family copper-binding protein [Planctomycetota bacterium]|nr:plastocyanin/azurin family copper-binding protein [Planctomycetota bacterium]